MSPRLTLMLVAAALLVSGALGLYWKGRNEGASAERAKTAAAEARAVVADLETKGARESLDRAVAAAEQRRSASAILAAMTPAALASEDAHAPLEPARAARLRDADRRLCELAPDLVGCATD